MSRTTYQPAAVLGLAALLLTYVGCSSGTDSETSAGNPSIAAIGPTRPQDTSSGARKKLFADWPNLAGALIITGEQDGYLEPCGCTEGQLGGLRRRFDLIERMEAQHIPRALVDLGSLIKNPAMARGGMEEVKAQFAVGLKALSMMKYDALALSLEDLKIGVGEAFGQFINLERQPKVVVANVEAASDFRKNVVPSVRATAGPIRIGITATIDPGEYDKFADNQKEIFLPKVIPLDHAIPAVLDSLKKDTDVQVLLVQGPPEQAKELAEKYPDFDVVVATSKFADPPEDAERLNNGKTLLVTVGQKGKYVGVVGLFQDPNQRFRYQRQSMNTNFNGPAEPMRKLIEDDFQQMLKDGGVVENFPRRAYEGDPGRTFAGAAACKVCHPGTYQKWATTKHSHAFEDIVKDPKGRRSDHQFDAECVSCHTTGFEFKSGWVSLAATPQLQGNQCENCHGPASKHVAAPDNADFRKEIARKAESFDANGYCLKCHDEDNSPHFSFDKYWSQIVHKNLDDYKDPKVRKGLDLKALPK